MILVQALVSGPFAQIGERFMIRSLEEGKWKTDRGSVEVDPGLIVSFIAAEDRDHFLKFVKHEPPRGEIPVVDDGQVLLFAFEQDVASLEAAGAVRRLSPDEVQSVIEQSSAGEPIVVEKPDLAADDDNDDGDDEDEASADTPAAKPKASRKKRAK